MLVSILNTKFLFAIKQINFSYQIKARMIMNFIGAVDKIQWARVRVKLYKPSLNLYDHANMKHFPGNA